MTMEKVCINVEVQEEQLYEEVEDLMIPPSTSQPPKGTFLFSSVLLGVSSFL